MQTKIKLNIKEIKEKEVSIPEFFTFKEHGCTNMCRLYEDNHDSISIKIVSNGKLFDLGVDYIETYIKNENDIKEIKKEDYINSLEKAKIIIQKEIELCHNL